MCIKSPSMNTCLNKNLNSQKTYCIINTGDNNVDKHKGIWSNKEQL